MPFSPPWTHDLDPIIYQFTDSLAIRWYGLAYVIGFMIGAWLLHIYYKKGLSPLDTNQQSDLFLAIIAGVIIGGRLGYFIFYAPSALLENPLTFFKFTDGGMASHGGFIGVILAGWIMSKRLKIEFLKLGDILATLALPACCWAGWPISKTANFGASTPTAAGA